MKKKNTLILVIQMILLVATAFGFMMYTKNEIKPVTVYTFNKDLNVNQQITSADLAEVKIPQSAVSADFVTNSKDVLHKFVDTKVYANSYINKKQIKEEDQLDPFQSLDLSKYRKISLPISYVDGFGGNIKRGDAVDIVFSGTGKTVDKKGMEQIFHYSKASEKLQNLLVFNVTTAQGVEYIDRSQSSESNQSGEKIDTSSNSDELAVITLAVTLDQAEEITARMNAGQVRLVSRFEKNESYETLGFVLGEYSKVYSAPANAETGHTMK